MADQSIKMLFDRYPCIGRHGWIKRQRLHDGRGMLARVREVIEMGWMGNCCHSLVCGGTIGLGAGNDCRYRGHWHSLYFTLVIASYFGQIEVMDLQSGNISVKTGSFEIGYACEWEPRSLSRWSWRRLYGCGVSAPQERKPCPFRHSFPGFIAIPRPAELCVRLFVWRAWIVARNSVVRHTVRHTTSLRKEGVRRVFFRWSCNTACPSMFRVLLIETHLFKRLFFRLTKMEVILYCQQLCCVRRHS